MASSQKFETWLRPEPSGLYCEPGDFYIDPLYPVERAVVTHGHSDHARPGHQAVLATGETLGIMKVRLGDGAGKTTQALKYNELCGLERWTAPVPAGHILGSARLSLIIRANALYFRRLQASSTRRVSVEAVKCYLFITEATFGVPVFKFEPPGNESKNSRLPAASPTRPPYWVYGWVVPTVISYCAKPVMKPIWLHGVEGHHRLLF